MTDKPQKTALVTGGAKRIGAAIVQDLARAGFGVAIHANSSLDEAQALAAAINASGGKARAFQADLNDAQATAALVTQACDAFGGLGLVVNNASIFAQDTLTGFDEEIWDRHFNLHVKAPSIIAAEFARLLPDAGRGLIINMIDQRVWKLNPRFYSYTLSKTALWTATQTMAQTLAPRIRVNAIGPGPSMPSSRQNIADFNKQAASVLLKHGPETEEFTRTILYLFETPSITGQMIALDGGQHLAWQTPDILEISE